MLHERDVVSRTTTLRNTFSGSVQRVTGKYDVLSVVRLSAGLCLSEKCHEVGAIDVASATLDDFSDAQLPILTAPTKGRGGSHRAPVALQDKDMLSLGRGVLADPAWLRGAHGPWRVRADVLLSAACHANGIVQHDKLPGVLQNGHRGWSLANATAPPTDSQLWLQAIASVACRKPGWLIRHSRLCATAGAARDFAAMQHWRPGVSTAVQRRCGVTWYLRPPAAAATTNGTDGGAAPSPSPHADGCGGPFRRTEVPFRPPWLPGLGAREINPASGHEAALASRLTACRVPAAAGAPFWRTRLASGGWPENYIALAEVREGLSHHFNSAIFNVDPPPDRAEAIDIVLSLIVLLPEAAALAVQACLAPGRYSMAAMVATFAVGAVSLSGVGMLAILEVRGSTFHATADLDWLEAHVTPAVAQALPFHRNLTGAPLVRSETLLLISAVGYRPRLLVGLAVGSAVLYTVVSVSAFIAAFSLRKRARLAAVRGEQQGPYGGSWPATWWDENNWLAQEDPPPSPAERVAAWALRRGPGQRCLSLRRPTTTRADMEGGSPLPQASPSSAPPRSVPWLLEGQAEREAGMPPC